MRSRSEGSNIPAPAMAGIWRVIARYGGRVPENSATRDYEIGRLVNVRPTSKPPVQIMTPSLIISTLMPGPSLGPEAWALRPGPWGLAVLRLCRRVRRGKQSVEIASEDQRL